MNKAEESWQIHVVGVHESMVNANEYDFFC